MILFYNDWQKYPNAIVDVDTPNKSFLKIASIYKKMGVQNHAFMLALHNPLLKGVDPHSKNLSKEEIILITEECVVNPWYFFREVCRVPASGFDEPIPFIASRGNICLYWCFFNHITTYLIQIRQTGKSVGCDCLDTYIMQIGGRNTSVQLLTKDDNLRVENVKRIKEIMSGLPPYLDLRSKKDTNNTELITVSALKNTFKTAVAQQSPKAAMNIGRGMTSNIIHIDEFAFIANIEQTMTGLMPSSIAARENAKRAGNHYGTIYTTTAGYLSTRSGKFAYDVYCSGYRFQETLFDSVDLEDAENTILKNSKSKSPLVIAEFNHRQLGKTDEWLRRVIAESMSKGENAEAEFLNKWSSGSESCPIPKERLEEMNRSINNDPIVKISKYGYATRWYIPEEELATNLEHRTMIVGLDTSEAIGADSIAMHIADITTGETIAVGEYNETNVILFSEWLAEFLIEYPTMTLIPERKSTGVAIIDGLIKILITKNINPYRRIFNTSVQNINNLSDSSEEYELIHSNSVRLKDLEIFSKYKKSFGYVTAGSGTMSRGQLYGDGLNGSYTYRSSVVRDKTLYNQLAGLVVKNGRLDHRTGGNDDMVIAWLLGYWLMTKGENLDYYNIDKKMILSAIIKEDSDDLSPQELEDRHFIKSVKVDIQNLLKELENATNDYHAYTIENKIRHLMEMLPYEETKQAFNIETLIEKIKENKKIRSY